MLQPGVTAPEISLPDLNGTPWTLGEALRQGPVVLAFFKVSCPVCQFTLPFLQRLADTETGGLVDSQPRLIAVSQDDVADSREFQQRFGVFMPTVIDARPGYSASNAYRITSVPSIFVVETDAGISSAVEGFNKAELQKLGRRFHVDPFRDADRVPALRPG
jgi:peroxiredoxin